MTDTVAPETARKSISARPCGEDKMAVTIQGSCATGCTGSTRCTITIPVTATARATSRPSTRFRFDIAELWCA